MTIANFEFILKATRRTRANMLGILESLSLDQINKIPDGFRNNLVWNYGHAIVTQQLLCYSLSGLKPNIDKKMIEIYRKGGAPQGPVSQAEFADFKVLSDSLLERFQEDYAQGIFTEYKTYTTSYNVTLSRIEEAWQFNLAHEALHLGTMLAMKKLVL